MSTTGTERCTSTRRGRWHDDDCDSQCTQTQMPQHQHVCSCGQRWDVVDSSASPAGVRLTATMRLAVARQDHPELKTAESEARLNLAAAIITLDEVQDTPGRHNLAEQAAVERAKDAYAQALANLLRGEA